MRLISKCTIIDLTNHLLNNASLYLFFLLLKLKGYRIIPADTAKLKEKATALKHEVYSEERKYSLPKECLDWNNKNQENAISFIAYFKNTPVGTVSLYDPSQTNRLYAGFGINEDGVHFEIGSLAIKKEFRDGQMFVFLGLIGAITEYSYKNSVKHWMSISSKNLYRTLRKFNKEIKMVPASTENGKEKFAIMLYDTAQKNIPTNVAFSMEVTSFVPWRIVMNFIKDNLMQLRVAK